MPDIVVSVAPQDPAVISEPEDMEISIASSDVSVVPLGDDMVIVPKVADLVIGVQSADLAVAISNVGPPGATGPSGASAVLIREAIVQPLGGNRIVRAVAGGVDYASSDDTSGADAIVGFTQTSAILNASVAVQVSGEMIEPSWNWTVGDPVYCGLNGLPTQVPPTSGFLCRVGKATDVDAILINIEEAILLA